MNLPRVLLLANLPVLDLSPGRVRTELRRGNWRRLGPGVVLTRPEPPRRVDLMQMGLALGGSGAAVTGWDAVRSFGIGPEQPLVPQVVVLTRGGPNRVIGDVRFRRTTRTFEGRYARIDGASIRTVEPARAVADSSLDCVRLDSARALVTTAVQRGLCTIEDLARMYEEGPRNRSYFLRRAVLEVIEGARSVAEADAMDALRAAAVPPFEMNVRISPRLPFIADFLWREVRAVLEIDSRKHHFAERDWLATMRRHNALSAAGFAVTHWAPADIRADPQHFGREVRRWLSARAQEVGKPALAS